MGKTGAGPAVGGLPGPGLLKDLMDQGEVILVGLGPGEGFPDLAVVDEFLCFQGFGVVLEHIDFSFSYWSGNAFPVRFRARPGANASL